MPPEISLVIPIYNEAPNIEALYGEITAALAQWGRTYEVLLIDDGSTDGSAALLAALPARDARFRIIRFRKNFGQTPAFSAGFAYARGKIIITSDGDLQNDPKDIPMLVARLEEGNDIVCGWRKDRKDTLVTRRIPSILANKLISRATGVDLHDYGCSLKAFRSDVVKPLRLYGEMHRFIPAIASEFGVKVAEVVVNHRARRAGTSKYGLSRTVRVVLDLITVKYMLDYFASPMKLFGRFGFACFAVAIVAGITTTAMKLVAAHDITGNPLTLLTVLGTIAAIQFFSLGLLGEVNARIYYGQQRRQNYAIRELVNCGNAVDSSPIRRAA